MPRFTGNVHRQESLSIQRIGKFPVSIAVPLMLLSLVLSCTTKPGYRVPAVDGNYVTVDVLQLKDIKPEFFSLTLDDKRIDFFVVRVGRSVESYINACRKCFRHKKGFREDDVHLVCRYCNVRYPLRTLKTGIGNCSPIPLKGELTGQWYRIRLENIKEASKYF